MNENFAELLKEYDVKLDKKTVYNGQVSRVDRNSVLIESSFKSDVLIPMEEFTSLDGELKVGLDCEYQIKDFDDGFGQVVGTRQELIENRKWRYFEEFQNGNKTISGLAIKSSSGGLVVRIKGVNCFIPKSLLDINYKVKADDLVGQEIHAKIMKINKEKDGVVLSRKAQVQEDNNIQYPEKNPKVGDRVTGIVKNIADFGAFVDLGYKDALLHISEMSWTKVKSISDILSEGDKLECEVVSVSNDERAKISLSLKNLKENPWNEVNSGDKVKAVVVKKERYGVICALDSGIEGVINNENVDPEALEIGEEVQVEIDTIEIGKMTLKWIP
jgi:small subunit ribosomal protein S1